MEQRTFEYFPVSRQDQDWGFYILCAGCGEISRAAEYPPGGHPDKYAFDFRRGRVLPEFQLIYIPRGGGRFESEAAGSLPISQGDVFFVIPGQAHRYRPDPETGWHEYWVGFDGEFPRRLLERGFIDPRQPVVRLGNSVEAIDGFRRLFAAARDKGPGFQQLMAAAAGQILATVQAARQRVDVGDDRRDMVEEVKRMLEERPEEDIDLEAVARRHRISYSSLRHLFKVEVGMAPRHYQLHLRIQRAATLLRDTDLPVKQIAIMLGFEDPYYFSRLFKARTRLSPQAFRDEGSGRP